MAIRTYILIITFNVNGLKAKDRDWLKEHKNNNCIYAVYKRPTSDLGTHTD